MTRTDPAATADERTTLVQFLDYQRATLLMKAEGLDREQLNQPLPTSSLTLAGLLKHLAFVEDYWIQEVFLGRPLPEPWASAPFDTDGDWEFHSSADDDPDAVRELYEAACARGRGGIEGASLDAVSVGPSTSGRQFSLRWILVHMVEETARHCGHADLLREAIDGVVDE
jgi:uncharacterized damage-inducible protein DinB